MGRLKKEFKNGFTTVSNDMYRDQRLSISERGLLGTMLSLPDDWDFSIKGLVSIVSDGERVIRSRLRKLEETGYLKREKVIGLHGRISDWEYTFADSPLFLDEGEQLKLERERTKAEKNLLKKEMDEMKNSPVGQNEQVDENPPVGHFAHVEDAVVENAVVQNAHTNKYNKQSNTKELNTKELKCVNENSSNELDSGDDTKLKQKVEKTENKLEEKKSEEKSLTKYSKKDLKEKEQNLNNSKKSKTENGDGKQNLERNCDTKELQPYLNLIKSLSDDRNIQNSFYRFLKIRIQKHRLSVDEFIIKNFIQQLREFSSQMYNGQIHVYDEVLQAILTTAVTSESKTIYDLNSWTKSQIIQKANQKEPVWSHVKEVPVGTDEENEQFKKEFKELCRQQFAALENKQKGEQTKKRGVNYGSDIVNSRT